MSEKEYYNEIVLQEYYHKLFDEEIEKKIIQPLKASIINTFTEFVGESVMSVTLSDIDGREVRVKINVEKVNWNDWTDIWRE